MSRPSRIPSYRLHKQSGQAVVTLTDGLGGRKDVLLGKHDTPESRTEYARVIGEWEARGRKLYDQADEPGTLSVNELCVAFLRHADNHYRRDDGSPTSEPADFRLAIRPLHELYGLLPVTDFGPLKLKAVRQTTLIAANLSRGVVNHRIRRIVRIMKWGVAEEIVPESVWRSLTTVRGLEKGRSTVRETEPIGPVTVEVVEATLPYLLPPVRVMVELQRLTGMRPGEVCAMRACDLDTTGEVWLYRPAWHKTKHRGKERIIALGPKSQAVVKPFLKLDTQAYLFSPQDALAALRQRQGAGRKSKVPPSPVRRKKRQPKRQPGPRYRTLSYGRAIAKAIRRANTAAACDACKPLKLEQRCEKCQANAIPHWHPHQLRHTHATEVRRRFGLEAAQVALGHSQAQVTEVYAERDLALAAKVAQQIG